MESKFRYSFCYGTQPDTVEKGEAPREKIMEELKGFPWIEELRKMEEDDVEVYNSPSVEIENIDTKYGLCISIVGEPGDHEYMIFYNRPGQAQDDAIEIYDKDRQSWDDVTEAVNALLDNNTDFLDKKFID